MYRKGTRSGAGSNTGRITSFIRWTFRQKSSASLYWWAGGTNWTFVPHVSFPRQIKQLLCLSMTGKIVPQVAHYLKPVDFFHNKFPDHYTKYLQQTKLSITIYAKLFRKRWLTNVKSYGELWLSPWVVKRNQEGDMALLYCQRNSQKELGHVHCLDVQLSKVSDSSTLGAHTSTVERICTQSLKGEPAAHQSTFRILEKLPYPLNSMSLLSRLPLPYITLVTP